MKTAETLICVLLTMIAFQSLFAFSSTQVATAEENYTFFSLKRKEPHAITIYSGSTSEIRTIEIEANVTDLTGSHLELTYYDNENEKPIHYEMHSPGINSYNISSSHILLEINHPDHDNKDVLIKGYYRYIDRTRGNSSRLDTLPWIVLTLQSSDYNPLRILDGDLIHNTTLVLNITSIVGKAEVSYTVADTVEGYEVKEVANYEYSITSSRITLGLANFWNVTESIIEGYYLLKDHGIAREQGLLGRETPGLGIVVIFISVFAAISFRKRTNKVQQAINS